MSLPSTAEEDLPARREVCLRPSSLVEGSDPILKHEYVAIGAHYDGAVGPPAQPDAIYNAADVALVAAMLVFSYFLGQRHWERATGEPYEGG